MKLKSALEAAGIKPAAPITLDTAPAAEYITEYLCEHLGGRVVKNHDIRDHVQAAAHGFEQVGVSFSFEPGFSQDDFDRYVRGVAESLGVLVRSRVADGFVAFAPGSTDVAGRSSVVESGNVSSRVWLYYENGAISGVIDVLCLFSR